MSCSSGLLHIARENAFKGSLAASSTPLPSPPEDLTRRAAGLLHDIMSYFVVYAKHNGRRFSKLISYISRKYAESDWRPTVVSRRVVHTKAVFACVIGLGGCAEIDSR